ncbi:MAG: M16 family metallopeptidase [Planctomycetota bacterium]
MNRTILQVPLLLLSFLALLVTGLSAQETKLVSEVEGISEFRLSNGVQVLLFPDDSKPNFTVNMTVLVGSRHEGYGETGMAHLLEHMLFKGTPTHNDIPALLKDRGVLNLNGTTWLDRTNYVETLPSKDDNLECAIKMDADRLLNSTIKGEDLLSEMTVVRNEFEMGENSPSSILMQRLMATAYEWHNYGKTTIGNRSDIERVPLDNLRRFYSKYYQPDNIMVVVAGKFEQKEALELLEKYFGSLKTPDRELPKTYTEEPVQDGERVVVLRRVGDVQMAGVGYHIPAAADPDFVVCEVLGQILGLEPGGLLYKNLVESGIASSASTFNIPGHDPGMLLAFCEVSKEKDLETAKNRMLETIEAVGNDGVSEDDVKRAVQRLLKEREQTFANTEAMAIELSEWRAYGDWRLFFIHRDRLEKVTAADVQRVAKAWCVPSNRTVGLFIPTTEPVRAPLASQPKVKELVGDYKGRAKIAAGESFEPTPENIESRLLTGELSSGLKIAMLPKKTRDSRVNVVGKLDFGTLESMRGQATAAALMGSMLSRGTKQLSFQQFRDALDNLRATLSFTGAPGSLQFSIQTKRENLPEVLKLLEQALKEPAFADSELEIVRRENVAQMEQMKSDPQGLAVTEFQRVFSPYEQDDPRYAPTIDESIARMNAVKVEQIRDLHDRFVGGQHGQIAVVGDFDPAATREQLDKLFAGWTTKEAYARIPEPAITGLAGKRTKINTPDKANAVYIAGMMLPLRDDHPDYEALAVANYVLGGGPLASRLADRVRKKEGLSYGVGSMVQADSQDERSMLMMFAISNPENTEKVVGTIDEEVGRFVESGVQAEELNNAVSSYLETRKGARANDGQLAGLLLKNLETGRSMKFQAESDQKIRLLTKERVDAVIKNLLDKQRLIIITAGDFEKANAAAGEGEKK